jgi:hypothetical protein
MNNEPMLTARQRAKVLTEILGLIGSTTDKNDEGVIRFVAVQVGRQTREEAEFCKHDVRGRP